MELIRTYKQIIALKISIIMLRLQMMIFPPLTRDQYLNRKDFSNDPFPFFRPSLIDRPSWYVAVNGKYHPIKVDIRV
jgi:hypothetical protein